ncbi:MAG: hypothetical protein JOZ16_08605 [Methylobacteriaceae bacterium]|nr:hypothetical protein [Methylobacteriaceae bacterium]
MRNRGAILTTNFFGFKEATCLPGTFGKSRHGRKRWRSSFRLPKIRKLIFLM